MKLSEAIRAGDKRPLVSGAFKKRVGTRWGTCPLGGAYEVVVGKLPRKSYFVTPVFNALRPLLSGQRNKARFLGRIVDLADNKGWTREQIADWVEQKGY